MPTSTNSAQCLTTISINTTNNKKTHRSGESVSIAETRGNPGQRTNFANVADRLISATGGPAAHSCATVRHRLHLVLETIASENQFMVHRVADIGDHAWVEQVTKQRSISRLPFASCRAQSLRLVVLAKRFVDGALGVGAVARPAILAWVIDHPRPHWVKFDLPVARQRVAFTLDQAGLESSFPQGPKNGQDYIALRKNSSCEKPRPGCSPAAA